MLQLLAPAWCVCVCVVVVVGLGWGAKKFPAIRAISKRR
jgi:hypothetical protein